MAQHKSQMKDILQPDLMDEHKQVPEGEYNRTRNTNQASAYSVSETERRREGTMDKQGCEQRKEPSSYSLLSEFKKVPQCHKTPEPLFFDRTHTVLVDVDLLKTGRVLKAQEGRELWHINFVKMPCSPESAMFTKTGFLKQTSSKVWRWKVISKELDGLAKKRKVTVDDVAKAVMEYNPKYKGHWSFDALSSLVKCHSEADNYYLKLLPKIAALALRLSDQVKKAIPLLKKGRSASITLSQVQISCLLANAFYCTFPHRNTSNPSAEYHNYPTINFNALFGNFSARKKEKLKAIFHYFKVVTDDNDKPGGLVTFERHCLSDRDTPMWRSCMETMSKLHVTSDGYIETEGKGMLQVDFASSLIGGGVLSSGLVQEEILFLMNPELIVARLFTEKLEKNECLIIKGSQQFSCYSGFSDTFKWEGSHKDLTSRDEWGRLHRQILAIDAVNFKDRREQYSMLMVTRELNKAYCGFMAHGPNDPDIATGNWGCGAFHGDLQLKAVIQLMAAAVARKGMAFFTFGNNTLTESLQELHHLLFTQRITVGKLYKDLEDYCAVQVAGDTHVDLFQFIRNIYQAKPSRL
ncbi:poly(ADP-ribose) glycohydrolase isoform 1-T2 [Polymixia lowei]